MHPLIVPTLFYSTLFNGKPHSLMHPDSDHHLDSVAHIMNGCKTYKGLYTTPCDHIVDFMATAVSAVLLRDASGHKMCSVTSLTPLI